VQLVIALCIEAWPNCFAARAPRRKPLKIGIRDDILALTGDAIEARLLTLALRYYTSNIYYQGALTQPGAVRSDLAGKPAGLVTDDEREHARERFAVLLAKSRHRTNEKPRTRVAAASSGNYRTHTLTRS
jgi:sRNA-binding protein